GGLASLVLQILSAGGDVVAPLPATADAARAQDFETGGITSRRATLAWLDGEVAARSSSLPGAVFIVQDLWAHPGDGAVKSVPARKFFNGDNVYYLLDCAKHAGGAAAELVTMAHGFQWLAVLTTAAPADIARLDGTVSDEAI